MITKTINTDLWIRERPQEIHAVQGDTGARKIAVKLLANKAPWVPEEGASLVIRYRKPDGIGGSYDTLPDGEKAWELEGNTVFFVLAPQLLTVPGRVEVQVEIICGKSVLASFALHILVEENVAAGATRSQPYFNWLHRLETKLKEKLKEAKDSGAFDGAAGLTPQLQMGTVTSVEAENEAAAWIEGPAEKPVIHLQIPKGADAVVDGTLSVAGQAADAAVVGGVLAEKLTAMESAEYPGCYYRIVNGVTEWLNPPMVVGVGFRTAERHKGKAVYYANINFGALPNNSRKTVYANILEGANFQIIGGLTAKLSNGILVNGVGYDANNHASGAHIMVTNFATAIAINTDYDASSVTAEVFYKYTID